MFHSAGTLRAATLAVAALLPAAVFCEPPPGADVEWLGEAVIAPGAAGAGPPVGGLSGLSYDAERRLYVAVSDDAGRLGPPRLYELKIDLASGRLEKDGATVERAILLRRSDGSTFPRLSIDPEGLARTPEGHWIIASEGHVDSGVPAALLEFGPEGEWVGALRLPRAFKPRRKAGVRHNLALESATISPDGRWLFTAVENALLQDGDRATATAGSPSRLLRFDLGQRRLESTYLYRTEPIAEPPRGEAFAVNGLVDLLALSGRRLLALERSFTAGRGNVVRVFEIDLGDTAGRRLGRRAARAGVAKRLLFDVGELGVEPDNLEGMAFGPALTDGRRTLVLVADDNFNPGAQRTQVLAFALTAQE